jgi:thioredoxin-related protein
MPQVSFEPMIPMFERAKAIHASDRAATVVGSVHHCYFCESSVRHSPVTIQRVHKIREYFKLFIAQELQIMQTSYTCHFEEKLCTCVLSANARNSLIYR